jgi:hypothetical protein
MITNGGTRCWQLWLVGLSVLAMPLRVFAQEQPLKIEVAVDESWLAPESGLAVREEGGDRLAHVRAGSRFRVNITVTNQGAQPASFTEWTCSVWDTWGTNSRAVYVQEGICYQNVPWSVTLQPTQREERKLVLTVARDASAGPISFRVGLLNVQEPVWSNEVTIHVEPAPEPHSARETDEPRQPIRLDLQGEVVGIEEGDARWFIVKVKDRYGHVASLWAARERFAPEEFQAGRQVKATFSVNRATFEPDPTIDRRYLDAVTFVAQ